MRFKLSLQITGTNNLLPVNYQYELSSWIYKTIHFGDPEFAKWLHNQGYTDGHKQFKLFTFSQLYPDKYRINADRLELQEIYAHFAISFYVPETAEPFIIGLFRNQEFTLGDRKSQVTFTIKSIEKLPDPVWAETMHFRTQSSIVISKNEDSLKTARYLSPEDDGYEELLLNNLNTKYGVVTEKPENSEKPAWFWKPCKFEILTKPRSKLIKIKAGTPQETSVRGFLFDFSISAPVDLIKLGYYAGFGEKNSLGFGSVEVF